MSSTTTVEAALAAAGHPLRAMRERSEWSRAAAADVDERRAVSSEITDSLTGTGVFNLLAPRSIGGGEVSPLTFFDVVEEASNADGSVGWIAMIGGCSATFGGMLPPAAARSGGMPVMREFWFPADQTTVIDTWHRTGLRGTASHDDAVQDVFVPAERSCWFIEPPVEEAPLYRMAPVAMFATFLSAVPLGIARHAIDAYVDLSQTKVPVLSQSVLADRPVANNKLGRAKALVDSGRAYVRGRLAEQWDAVCAGRPPTMADRGELWLSATHAAHTALEAIELVHEAAIAAALIRSRPRRGGGVGAPRWRGG